MEEGGVCWCGLVLIMLVKLLVVLVTLGRLWWGLVLAKVELEAIVGVKVVFEVLVAKSAKLANWLKLLELELL